MKILSILFPCLTSIILLFIAISVRAQLRNKIGQPNTKQDDYRGELYSQNFKEDSLRLLALNKKISRLGGLPSVITLSPDNMEAYIPGNGNPDHMPVILLFNGKNDGADNMPNSYRKKTPDTVINKLIRPFSPPSK
ncbi:MAG: hypothetical protein EPN37_11760 [Chitinophagaceae bacterium]|jgi:hypothetical protein|nr:MAG: hypothetical protein EPN37_11760 [Chitinophagaceae bacterium]